MKSVQRELRRHQRILVPEGCAIRCEGSEPKLEGAVTVIGLGGMFIRTPNSQPVGTILKLVLKQGTTTLNVQCAVRHVSENGMGVEFVGLSPADEKNMSDLLHQLRPHG